MPIQTKPLARKWRDVLTIHPAAELFPRMTPDELRALGEDIKKNGQRQPIAIIERARRRPDGTLHVNDPPLQEVLDGISRLDAMEAAGIAVIGKDGQLHKQVLRTVVDTDEVDPVTYVVSVNIHRRHLNREQKRDLIAKLLKATPGKSDRQIAETVKASPTTVGSVRAEMESTVQVGQLDKRVGKDGKVRKQPSSKPSKARKRTLADDIIDEVVFGKTAKAAADKPKPPDDIGADSRAEVERLRERVEELQAQVRQRDSKIAGLEREIEELRAKLATATGGGMSVSEFEATHKRWEESFEVQRGIIARLENENANLRAKLAGDPGPFPEILVRKPKEMTS
jgi:hypothetical protein